MPFGIPSLPEKMEITAIPAISKCFGPGEPDLPQAAVGYIIHIAEQPAQFRASILDAGCMPEALRNGDIVVVPAALLCADLKIGCTHNLKKDSTVNGIKSRDPFHPGRCTMFLRSNHIKHVPAQMLNDLLLRTVAVCQHLVQGNSRKNRLRQRLHLVLRLVHGSRKDRIQSALLLRKQFAALILPEFPDQK